MRSKDARYNGKIRGPKDSTKSGRDIAGWNGARTGLLASNPVASLKDPDQRGPLDFVRRMAGDSGGES